jgi:hypothetical protein
MFRPAGCSCLSSDIHAASGLVGHLLDVCTMIRLFEGLMKERKIRQLDMDDALDAGLGQHSCDERVQVGSSTIPFFV